MRNADELPPEEMPRQLRRESPFSSDWEHVFEAGPSTSDRYGQGGFGRSRNRPETDMQALMEAAPFEEPEVSKAENLPLKDAIADAIDQLDDRSRWVFEKVHYEGYSLRELEPILSLSKSQVHRIYQNAVAQLQTALTERFDIT